MKLSWSLAFLLAMGAPSPFAQATVLLNEKSQARGTEVKSLAQHTPGVLMAGDGGFFCNAFVGVVKKEKRLFTASHCSVPDGDVRFVWLDTAGKTQEVAVSGTPDFAGELDWEEETARPVDLAVWRADFPQDIAAPSLADIPRLNVPKTGQKVNVVYFHKANTETDALKLHLIECWLQASVPKIRASVKEGTEVVHSRDFQIGVSRKGIAYDEDLGIFLDRCQVPLPEGASGALIIDGDGGPLALLQTGVTTKQLALGWHDGGWADTFWAAAPGDGGLSKRVENGDLSLGFHYLASDSQAYGPLSQARAVQGKGKPLFLFGAAFRLSELSRFWP